MKVRASTLLTNLDTSHGRERELINALRSRGFADRFERELEALLTRARQALPDLLLIAVREGDSDAVVMTCEGLAGDPALSRLPIVCISNDMSDAQKAAMLDAGAADVVDGASSAQLAVARISRRLPATTANRWEAVLEALPDGLVLVDGDKRILDLYPSGSQLFAPSWTRGALLDELPPNEPSRSLALAVDWAKKSGACALLPCAVEGEERTSWIEISTAWCAGSRDPLCVAILRDVTERQVETDERLAIERQQRERKTIKSISQLARGVSNDISNVLSAIMGFATVLEEDLPESDPKREDLGQIVEACWRGSDLARELRQLGSYETVAKGPVSVNQEVRSLAELLRETTGPDIAIETLLTPKDPLVHGVSDQIVQIVSNLCANAIDALGGGGALKIATELRAPRVDEVEAHPELAAGQHVVLTVEDTGRGMSADVLAQAFEPFFSTSTADSDSGLGLTMVEALTRNHGGVVTLESTPARGSKATVFLPALGSTSFEAEIGDEAQEGVGSVLVIDDDPLVRSASQRLFARLGRSVIVAKSGAIGLDIYRRNGSKIEFVVLDLLMPILSGAETFDKLKALDPDVKVVICSGGASKDATTAILDRGAVAFLRKPFSLNGLRDLLKSLFPND